MFLSGGEPVGLVMPLADGDKNVDVSNGPRLKMGDLFEPGNYKPGDVDDNAFSLTAGKGAEAMRVYLSQDKRGNIGTPL